MKILGISTSSKVASVAILEDNNILGMYTINNDKTHSTKLMPMMNQLFKDLGLTPNDINYLACDIGPGSFTGLRIGIASINAIGTSLNKPRIGISSLLGLAYNINYWDGLICSIIDAKHDNIYYALFDNNYNIIQNYNSGNINDVINLLPTDKKILFVGEYEEYKNILNNKFEVNCFFSESTLNLLNGASIAKAAFNEISLNNFDKDESIKPLYLRKSQAERLQNDNKN